MTDSISELFGRDPLQLTGKDNPGRRRIIEKYKENRQLFVAGIKPPKERKAPAANTSDLLDI